MDKPYFPPPPPVPVAPGMLPLPAIPNLGVTRPVINPLQITMPNQPPPAQFKLPPVPQLTPLSPQAPTPPFPALPAMPTLGGTTRSGTAGGLALNPYAASIQREIAYGVGREMAYQAGLPLTAAEANANPALAKAKRVDTPAGNYPLGPQGIKAWQADAGRSSLPDAVATALDQTAQNTATEALYWKAVTDNFPTVMKNYQSGNADLLAGTGTLANPLAPKTTAPKAPKTDTPQDYYPSSPEGIKTWQADQGRTITDSLAQTLFQDANNSPDPKTFWATVTTNYTAAAQAEQDQQAKDAANAAQIASGNLATSATRGTPNNTLSTDPASITPDSYTNYGLNQLNDLLGQTAQPTDPTDPTTATGGTTTSPANVPTSEGVPIDPATVQAATASVTTARPDVQQGIDLSGIQKVVMPFLAPALGALGQFGQLEFVKGLVGTPADVLTTIRTKVPWIGGVPGVSEVTKLSELLSGRAPSAGEKAAADAAGQVLPERINRVAPLGLARTTTGEAAGIESGVLGSRGSLYAMLGLTAASIAPALGVNIPMVPQVLDQINSLNGWLLNPVGDAIHRVYMQQWLRAHDINDPGVGDDWNRMVAASMPGGASQGAVSVAPLRQGPSSPPTGQARAYLLSKGYRDLTPQEQAAETARIVPFLPSDPHSKAYLDAMWNTFSQQNPLQASIWDFTAWTALSALPGGDVLGVLKGLKEARGGDVPPEGVPPTDTGPIAAVPPTAPGAPPTAPAPGGIPPSSDLGAVDVNDLVARGAQAKTAKDGLDAATAASTFGPTVTTRDGKTGRIANQEYDPSDVANGFGTVTFEDGASVPWTAIDTITDDSGKTYYQNPTPKAAPSTAPVAPAEAPAPAMAPEAVPAPAANDLADQYAALYTQRGLNPDTLRTVTIPTLIRMDRPVEINDGAPRYPNDPSAISPIEKQQMMAFWNRELAKYGMKLGNRPGFRDSTYFAVPINEPAMAPEAPPPMTPAEATPPVETAALPEEAPVAPEAAATPTEPTLPTETVPPTMAPEETSTDLTSPARRLEAETVAEPTDLGQRQQRALGGEMIEPTDTRTGGRTLAPEAVQEPEGIRGGEPALAPETPPEEPPAAPSGAAPPRPPLNGPSGATVTASGADPNTLYTFRYRVASLDDLTPSNTDSLAANPDYPQELQPRDRTRAASRTQIDAMARALNPDAVLGDVGTLDRGPMIVGNDGVVESGNGRILALRKARETFPQQWAAYQQRLAELVSQYGISPDSLDGMKDPVLVRERLTPVDRPAFAAEANAPVAMDMSASENAKADARRITDATIGRLWVGADMSLDQALKANPNREAVRGFLETLPPTTRAKLVDAEGKLNAQGLERFKAALFVKTYPGEAGQRLATAFFESTDPTVAMIKQGVFANLPSMAQAEGLMRTDARDPKLSIAGDLAKSVDMLARLRAAGQSVRDYMAQDSLFARELSPLQERFLEWFNENGRSSKRVRSWLDTYTDAVASSSNPSQLSMFDEKGPNKEVFLDRVFGKDQQEAAAGAPLFNQAGTEAVQTRGEAASAAAAQVSPQLAGTGLDPKATTGDLIKAIETAPEKEQVTDLAKNLGTVRLYSAAPGALLAGIPQQPGESDDDYRKRLQLAMVLVGAGIIGPHDTLVGEGKPFFSALTRHLGEKLADPKVPQRLTIPNLRAILKGLPIKEDEIAWTGLDDQMAAWEKAGVRPSKQDVTDWVKQHQVVVNEVVRGEPLSPELVSSLQTKVGEARAAYDVASQAHTEVMRDVGAVDERGKMRMDLPDDAILRMGDSLAKVTQAHAALDDATHQHESALAGTPTRYGNYVTPGARPGSYRELLMTLPEQSRPTVKVVRDGADWGVQNTDTGEWLLRGETLTVADQYAKPLARQADTQNYQSPHWNEPNILAHVRFDARTDAEGKSTLFVQEVQSDWAQAGRKGGFLPEGGRSALFQRRLPIAARILEIERREYDRTMGPDGDRVREAKLRASADPEYQTLQNEISALNTLRDEGKPPMPFAKTEQWAGLAFKRIVHWAADRGFERVAWTTGDMQNDRYALSKQVDTLAYAPETGRLNAWKDGVQVLSRKTTAKELPDVIGQEVAQKLLDQPLQAGYDGRSHILRDEQIAVGGDGMRGFYDRILPQVANKFGGKFGSRVGETMVAAGSHDITGIPLTSSVHSLDITDPMRESVLNEGTVLFHSGINPLELAQWAKEHPKAALSLAAAGFIIGQGIQSYNQEKLTTGQVAELTQIPLVNKLLDAGGGFFNLGDIVRGLNVYNTEYLPIGMELAASAVEVPVSALAKALGATTANTNAKVAFFDVNQPAAFQGLPLGLTIDQAHALRDRWSVRQEHNPALAFLLSIPLDPLNWVGWDEGKPAASAIAGAVKKVTAPTGADEMAAGSNIVSKMIGWSFSGVSRAAQSRRLAEDFGVMAYNQTAGGSPVRAMTRLQKALSDGKYTEDQWRLAQLWGTQKDIDSAAVIDLQRRMGIAQPVTPDDAMVKAVQDRLGRRARWTPEDIQWLDQTFKFPSTLGNKRLANITRLNQWAAEHGQPDLTKAIQKMQGMDSKDFQRATIMQAREAYPPDYAPMRAQLEKFPLMNRALAAYDAASPALKAINKYVGLPIILSYLANTGWTLHAYIENTLRGFRGAATLSRKYSEAFADQDTTRQVLGHWLPMEVLEGREGLSKAAFDPNALTESYLPLFGAQVNRVPANMIRAATKKPFGQLEAARRNLADVAAARASGGMPEQETIAAMMKAAQPTDAMAKAGETFANVVEKANLGTLYGVNAHMIAHGEGAIRTRFAAQEWPTIYKEVVKSLGNDAQRADAALNALLVRPSGVNADVWARVSGAAKSILHRGGVRDLVENEIRGTYNRKQLAIRAMQEAAIPYPALAEMFVALNDYTPEELARAFAPGGYAENVTNAALEFFYGNRIKPMLDEILQQGSYDLSTVQGRRQAWGVLDSQLDASFQGHQNLWTWALQMSKTMDPTTRDAFFNEVRSQRQRWLSLQGQEQNIARRMFENQIRATKGVATVPDRVFDLNDSIHQARMTMFQKIDGLMNAYWADVAKSGKSDDGAWRAMRAEQDKVAKEFQAYRTDMENQKNDAIENFLATNGMMKAGPVDVPAGPATQDVTAAQRSNAMAALDRIRADLANFTNRPSVDPAQATSLRQWATNVEKQVQSMDPAIKEQVETANKATARLVIDRMKSRFVDNLNRTELDEFMHNLLPFWMYDARGGVFYLWMATHVPGLYSTGDRFMTQSNGTGYFQGGPNPTGYGPLSQDFGPLGNKTDPLRGMWPNRIITFAKQLQTDRPATGQNLANFYVNEITQQGIASAHLSPLIELPAELAAGSPISLPPAIQQGSDIATEAGANFPLRGADPYLEYNIRLEMAGKGVNPDTATPQQRQDAERAVAVRDFAESNVPRFAYTNPEKLQETKGFQDAIDQYVSKPDQAWLRQNGYSPWQLVPQAAKQQLMKDNPDWQYFFSASDAFKTPEEQKSSQQIRTYLDAVQAETANRRALQEQSDADLQSGKIQPSQWIKSHTDNNLVQKGYNQALDAVYSQAKAALDNPTTKKLLTPEDLAVSQYYAQEGDWIKSNTTSDNQINWSAVEQARQQYFQSLPPLVNQYVQNRIVKNMTPTEIQFQQSLTELDGYNALSRWLGVTPARAQERVKEESTYSRMRAINPQGAAAYRLLHPLLAARLPRNPQRDLYLQQHPLLALWFSLKTSAKTPPSQADIQQVNFGDPVVTPWAQGVPDFTLSGGQQPQVDLSSLAGG